MELKTKPVAGDIIKIVGLDDAYLIINAETFLHDDPFNGGFLSVSVYRMAGVQLNVVQLAELLSPTKPGSHTMVNGDKVKNFWLKGSGRMHCSGMPLSLDDITLLGKCLFVQKHVSVTHEVVGQACVKQDTAASTSTEAR